MSIITNKNRNGSYTLSTIQNDRYVKRTYYGYTLTESKKLFTEYLKTV